MTLVLGEQTMSYIEVYVNNQEEEIDPMPPEDAEENIGPTTILDLPPEIMTQILDELSLKDLKEYKQVSLQCYHLIESIRPYLFQSKAICVYDGHQQKMSLLQRWNIWLQTIRGKFGNIYGSEFCLRNILYRSIQTDIMFWLKTKESQITHLELRECYLAKDDYNSIFSELKHIESFSIVESSKYLPIREFNNSILQDFETKLCNVAKENLKKLKKISITKRRTGFLAMGTNIISQFLDLIPKYCSNLDTIEIKDSTTYFYIADAFWNEVGQIYLHTLFRQIGKILSVNSKTLQNLTIETFEIEDVRGSNCRVAPMNLSMTDRRSVYDKPKLTDGLAFTYFVAIMMEQNWQDYNLDLKTLSFSFQVANINLVPLVIEGLGDLNPKTYLLEFFTQQKQLQRFNFGQLNLLSARREISMDFLDQLIKCFPENCYVNLEILECVANGMTNVEAENFFDNENSHIIRFGYINNLNRLPIQFEPNDIINRQDSTFGLRSDNLAWNFYYVNWPRLTTTYLLRKLSTLTQIRIKQTNVPETTKLKIDDTDLQLIIHNGVHLTQLSIEWCNMKNVSDCGLTGLSKESCQRMKRSKVYEIQNGDLVGHPISSLNCSLRVLRLGEVGENVSDVSARFAFNGLKLRILEILTPNFTHSDVEVLKNNFKFNPILKMNIRPLQ